MAINTSVLQETKLIISLSYSVVYVFHVAGCPFEELRNYHLHGVGENHSQRQTNVHRKDACDVHAGSKDDERPAKENAANEFALILDSWYKECLGIASVIEPTI